MPLEMIMNDDCIIGYWTTNKRYDISRDLLVTKCFEIVKRVIWVNLRNEEFVRITAGWPLNSFKILITAKRENVFIEKCSLGSLRSYILFMTCLKGYSLVRGTLEYSAETTMSKTA